MKPFQVVVAAIALLVAALPRAAEAQVRIPGFGGDRDSEAPRSLLQAVRSGAYEEECAASQQGLTQPESDASANDMFDIVNWLSTSSEPPPIAGEPRTMSNPQMEQFLNGILHRLEAIQPPPQGTFPRVFIEDSVSINAAQRQRGLIYVAHGAVDALNRRPREQEQLGQYYSDFAFIIAHEYAHVLMCHYHRAAQTSQNRRMLGSLATIGIGLAITGNLDIQNLGNNTYQIGLASGNAVRDQVFYALAGYTVMQTINSSLINPAWSRAQERDADALALEMMREIGANPIFVPQLLMTLRQEEDAADSLASQFLGSLPERAMNAAALSLAMETDNRGQSFLQTFGLSAGIDLVRRWRERQLGHFHEDPERRALRFQRLLDRFNELEGPDPAFVAYEAGELSEDGFVVRVAEQSPAARAQLERQGERARAASLSESNAMMLALNAEAAIGRQDVSAGCADANRAYQVNPSQPAVLRAMMSCAGARQAYEEGARYGDALVRSPRATPDDFVRSSTMWRAAGNRTRAEQALTRGVDRFHDADVFYMPRIQLLTAYQDTPAALVVADECAERARALQLKTQCASTASQLRQASGQPQPTPEREESIGGAFRSLGQAFRRREGEQSNSQPEQAQAPTR